MKTTKQILNLVLLTISALFVFALFFNAFRKLEPVVETQHIVGQPAVPEGFKAESSAPTEIFAKEEGVSDDYKLVVGANPTLNNKQTFSPPTGSVVVINEAQLNLLIEQTKKSRQQQTVQQ